MISPYPLRFDPILMEKVWGGRRLESFGKRLPAGKLIGESWELADLAATSPSGGGGGAARSVIAEGPLAGKTLADAIRLWGRALLGDLRLRPAGEFPLLVKFLDARENLSVQVHPSPAFAAAHPGAHLKTECWYILAAEPTDGRSPVIYKGIRPGVTPEAFARHITDGSVVNDLVAVPAIPGECHNLPSGTCHALGAGVLVAEVQTPSDTTFRVYDWGRQGRELHIEQALACIDFGPAPAGSALPHGRQDGRLVDTDYFEVAEASRSAGGAVALGGGAGPRVVVVLAGRVSVAGGGADPVKIPTGATALIPAAMVPTAAVDAGPGTRLLVVSVKNAPHDCH